MDGETYILSIFIIQLQSFTINHTVISGRDILGNGPSYQAKNSRYFESLICLLLRADRKREKSYFFGPIRKSLCQIVDHQKRFFPFPVPSEDGDRSTFRSVADFYPKVAENVQNFRHVLEPSILVFFIGYRDGSETKGGGGERGGFFKAGGLGEGTKNFLKKNPPKRKI